MIGRLLLVLLLTIALTNCDEKDKDTTPIVRPVKVITVPKSTNTVLRNFPGKILANQEAELSFEIPGTLNQLPINEGDTLKKASLIAALDPQKYLNLVKETEAQYIRTRADYLRAKKLVEGDFISRSDYDRKRSAYLQSEANYSTAKRDLNNTKIYAPFDGVVSKKYVDNFEKIEAKQKIVLFQDISHLDIEVNVPENIILNLSKDKKATPEVIFEGAPDKKFKASFKEFSSEADPDTQTYRVVFTMPSPKTINVLPGMSATIKVYLPDFKSGGQQFITIPSTAVFDGPDKKTYVWTIDSNTMKVHRKPVAVSRLDGNQIRITGGLTPGEKIVIAGVHYLQEGQQVKLLNDNQQ